MKKIKEPKDLGIRIGTHEQVIWETVAKETAGSIEGYEKALVVQREILKLAERRIAEEKEKFK